MDVGGGRTWSVALTERREELTRRWRLTLGMELRDDSVSYICEATNGDGTPAILKIAPPWRDVAQEIAAMRAWAGDGAPSLLRADEGLNALLFERIFPGSHPNAGVADDVAQVLHAIHVAPPAGVRSLGEAVRERLTTAAGASEAKLEWALATVARLELDPPPPVLLHGDFDQRNLLVCGRRGLCAIDPLPCIGDPAYDAASWVHAHRRPGRRGRLDSLVAATGLPRERVRDWAGVIAVHG